MPGRIWQNSSFLDRVLLPLLASTMLAAWVVPLTNALLASFVFAPAGTVVPFWVPIAVLYAGSALASHVPDGRAGRAIVACAGVLLGLIVTVVFLGSPAPGTSRIAYYWDHLRSWGAGIPVAVALFSLTVSLWLRAVTADWADAEGLQRGLLVGAAALGLLALVGGSGFGLGLSGEGIGEAMLVFVLSALMTLALADVSRTAAQSERGGASSPALGRYWFGTVTLVVLAVVAVAWMAGAIATPESARALVNLVMPALIAIREALAYVLLAIAYVIFWLLTPLINMFNNLQQREEESEQVLQATAEATTDLTDLATEPVSIVVPQWLQIAVAILVVALVALLIYRIVRRRRTSSRDGVLETRELDWSWGQMQEQLRRLFAGRRRAPSRYVPLADNTDPRATIRLAYRRLLAIADEAGLGRQRGQTPWAYGAGLTQAMPDVAQPIDDLTRAYVEARYAPNPPSAATVDSALLAAREIEAWMARGRAAPGNGSAASG